MNVLNDCKCSDVVILIHGLYLNVPIVLFRQYRRECLEKIGADLSSELDYMDTFALENPKNYQIWHHRRVIAEWLNNGVREMKFSRDVIDVDNKNYHAWAHR